mmetsp:Transcript_8980/g.23003  ORF Transcript_8980/g.23003 Transcript_8980/m.23003 type:complete len:263 (+) Transcript_8980:91-879(+)
MVCLFTDGIYQQPPQYYHYKSIWGRCVQWFHGRLECSQLSLKASDIYSWCALRRILCRHLLQRNQVLIRNRLHRLGPPGLGKIRHPGKLALLPRIEHSLFGGDAVFNHGSSLHFGNTRGRRRAGLCRHGEVPAGVLIHPGQERKVCDLELLLIHIGIALVLLTDVEIHRRKVHPDILRGECSRQGIRYLLLEGRDTVRAVSGELDGVKLLIAENARVVVQSNANIAHLRGLRGAAGRCHCFCRWCPADTGVVAGLVAGASRR